MPCGAILYAACRRRPPFVADATTFPPASLVGLWVLSIVPHDSTRKRRADLPLRGRCRRQKVGVRIFFWTILVVLTLSLSFLCILLDSCRPR